MIKRNVYGSDDETMIAKALFTIISAAVIVIGAIVMHFVIMIKGWGLSIQSWGWMIFLWFSIVVVTMVKDKIVKFIKDEV